MLIKKISECNSITWDVVGLGENFFLKNFIDKEDKIFFDVGTRTESHIIKELYDKNKEFHLFEPNPDFYNKLKQVYTESNIFINKLGLGNKKEKLTYYIKSQSFINRKVLFQNTPGSLLELTTLDQYCFENNISNIDFLKIDTEGFEINVIQGSSSNIDNCKTIQFEYGGTYLDAKTSLKQIVDVFFNLTKIKNWSIYLLQKNYLLQIDLENIANFETYRYSNFILTQKDLYANQS